MEKGTLVEFRQGGDRRLAVVDRPEGKKHWIAIDGRGQSHTLHPRDVTYTVAGQRYSFEDIETFRQTVEPYLDPTALEVAWELLVEDGEMVDPAGLAQILFSAQTPEPCYAAYYLLSEDKLYFKQRKDSYEPRPISQVAELKHQLEVETQRKQQWQTFIERLHQSLAGEPVEWIDRDLPWLNALERLATFSDEATNRTPASELLSHLDRPDTPEAAFQLLVDLKLWNTHENLFLRRNQIPTQFSAKVVNVAHAILHAPPLDPDENRLDLTHLKVYTIDDESTQEIDDGLSVELLEDGRQRIWIHIADPTRWISPGDELDLEARRRSTTLYLPTGMIPMFPSELATGPMSLVQGKVCCAFSFGVVLTPTGAIEDYCLHPSLIQPTYRLTYEDVDEMLELNIEAEAELNILHQSSLLRQNWRQVQGSITIRMPEASIKVSSEEEITISVLEESPARQLVAEMMILTGEVAGHYGQAHDLPLPFRNQPQPELPSEAELTALPAGPVRYCAIRSCMPRSEVSLTPSRHASLGLDTYTQVTSPIRRYSDLLVHFQLKAHLRGEVLPFTPEQLQELILSTSNTSYEAVLVERQTNRYWGLEYLRRNRDRVWDAVILRWLRQHENLGLVMLEDLGLELVMRFERTVTLGENIQLRVAHADPRRDVIQFQEVMPDATSSLAPAS